MLLGKGKEKENKDWGVCGSWIGIGWNVGSRVVSSWFMYNFTSV